PRTGRALPSAQDSRLRECNSESEEECPRQQGASSRGRSCPGHRRGQGGEKREEDSPRGPRKGQRPEARKDRGTPAPVGPCSPSGSPAMEHGLKHTDGPLAPLNHRPQLPANSKGPEGDQPPSDFPQEAQGPAAAQESAPEATRLRDGPGLSPAICEREGARPPAPEPTQPGRSRPPGSQARALSIQSTPAPGPGDLLGAPGPHHKEDYPADHPGGLLRPVSAHPEPHVLLVQNADAGCDPAGPDRDSVGGPPAGKEPHPSSSASTELLLRPRDLEGCLPGGLCSRPSAAHTQGASRGHLSPDSMDTLERRPLKHSPYAADTPPGSAPSPLTLESTSLFAGLPEDGFDPPLCHGQSADGDAHTPTAPAGTPPRKPLMDPLCPPFLLLEEEAPMLPSQFPGLSGGKTLGKKCPHEGPAPPAPGKGSECSLSGLSEEELEIKRLVSELESQLQRTEDTQGAPGGPGPGPEPASTPGDTVSALDLMGLGESNDRQEGVETGTATEEGARGGFQGEWPCPGPGHPRQVVPAPSTHEDPGSGAALGPPGSSISSQAEQMARVSEKEGDGRDLSGHLEATQSARRSPNQALLFPNETVRTQGTEDTPLWLPCEQSGRRSPEPPEAGGCGQGPPTWARGHPNVYLAPDLAIRADGDLPPGACHRVTSEEHSGGGAAGPKGAGLLFPMTEGPGFEGKGAAPAPQGREPRDPPTPSPGWVPQASPSKRPQALAPLCLRPLQVLEARAGGNDSNQGSQGVLLAAAHGPPHRGPPGPGGPGVESGSPGCKQVTADPAATGPQLAPQADGQLGPPGQAEKPEGCGEASGLQSVNWRKPGGPGSLARFSAHPGNPLARPARGTPEPEESQAPLGLGKQAQPTPGPSSSSGTRSPPALMAAHTQKGPEDRGPGKVSSSGLDPQLLFNRESSAPHAGDLGTHDATSIATATLALCSLEHLPGKDPPSMPASGPEAQSQPSGLLPAPTSCAQGPPSPSAWGQVGGASGVQAPPGARAREALAALPSLTTSHCGPKEILPGCLLLRARSPQDPPCCQPDLSAALTPTYKDYGLEVGPLRTLEGSKTEGLGRPPAYHSLPPPAGAISPTVITQAAGPSSIPTEDGTEMVRGLWVSDPHLSGATDTSPFSVSEGPSSEPPGNTPLLGHGEGESPSAVPTPPGATEPKPHAYLGGETGAGREGEGDPGTPGARHTGLRRAPRADTSGPAGPPSPAGLCQGQAASSSSTACDPRSGSPQSQASVPHLTPQKDPTQRPRGFQKNPEPTETGHQESHAPAGPGLPVTCETCSASFRSRPGLSRHRARKHPPRKPATCQPSPGARRGPRKRSHKGPGGDQPSPSVTSPGRTSGPSPIQGSTVPEDTLGPETLEEARRSPGEPRTPGSPLDQLPHPSGPVEQGEGVRASAPKPRRPGPPEVDQLPPQQTENREDQRRTAEPLGSPKPEGKWNRKVGKRGAGRARQESPAPASAGAGLGGRSASPVPAAANHAAANHAALLSCCLSREGACEASVGQWLRPATLGPEVLEDEADTGLGVLSAEMAPKSPRDQQLHPGKMEGETEGVFPGELRAGWRGASARRCRGPRDIREPELAAGSQPAETSRGARGRSGKRTGERAPDPPEASDSVVGNTISSGPRSRPGARAEVQGPQGTVPDARGPGPVDPPSSLDDEVSFSQLFPLGGRFTQKKNPRVYGKGCKRPKRPPPTEPRSEGGDLLHPTHLPPDLSDSGSLCLSPQDPWEDEAAVLPEPFLLDGLLGSKVPSLDPWAPSLSRWAPEPHREAGPGEEAPSCCAEDAESEAIPKLHMVPAAWRGLGLRVPNGETPPLGAESPEPPDLERERYDDGLPGSASLLPRPAKDLDMLSAKLETRDLCFLGPLLRRVRRPATPGQKALALESVLPSKRRKVVVPSSPPGLGVAVAGPLAGPLSLGSPTLSPPALPQLCPESAPSTTKSWANPSSPAAREDQRPPHSQELPPPALSPLPTALAGGSCDQGPDPTLERPEDKAWPGEQQPPREEKGPPPLFSGGHRSPGARSKCVSDGSPGDPFPLQKKKQVSTPHVAPERGTRGPSHKGGATKPPKQGAAASTPSHAPKPLVQPRKPVGIGSPAPREQAHSTEDRVKPTSPKAKPRASAQGNRCPWPGTKTGGGSQPQPASGRLQSETASTPARPLHPSPNPTSAKSPSRTQARGCTKGPREAGDQGPRGSPSPRETGEGREKRRKSQALELAKREGVGGSGRAPVAPDKPLRAPRKQPAPSRVLPTKPRPSSQNGKMRPPPSEQREAHSRAHRGEALSKHSPQARLPLRAPKRGRAVHSAEATRARDHRTAESQSNLLNQLFGQRLTSFKIPLKKFTSE
ncbi:zinc finger protein 469, partial [Marmota marmota marmota]|uniref:zinc finger protein 469 n=1 Tax=Marmota marmota marmota TaxID=9994 RepID=UPI0020924071